MADKAVLMYQKGGQLNRALEMCEQQGLVEPLQLIGTLI